VAPRHGVNGGITVTSTTSRGKARDDVHRPVDFIPEDYTYVDAYDNDGMDGTGIRRALAQLLNDSKTARYGDGYQCDHCGAHIRYVAVFLHVPTGDHIGVGETCCEGRFTYSKADFDRLRKDAALQRENHRIKNRRIAFVWEHPELVEVIVEREAGEITNSFILDVLHKLDIYGDLSDKQVSAIVKSAARDREYKATPKVEQPKALVPDTDTRINIEGRVISTRWQESDFGSQLKGLVECETPEGFFRLWGTVPSSLGGVSDLKGCRVRFSAKVQRSDKDDSFGFWSRPTKAEVVSWSLPCFACDKVTEVPASVDIANTLIYCGDCGDEAHNAVSPAWSADDKQDDEGPTCLICDGVGHGYPGAGPCPLEEDRGDIEDDSRERFLESIEADRRSL
jgi:hypothetical protein